MIRYVVRQPHIDTTPRALAAKLGCETRVVSAQQVELDASLDFFMAYPHRGRNLETVENIAGFSRLGKPIQRQVLKLNGLNVPETHLTMASVQGAVPGRWIVRPYRHSGGRNYRITETSIDFREGYEYIQRVFPKTDEYRIITVFGQIVILLKKKVNPGTSAEEPWNHNTGASFVTLNDWDSAKLKTRTNLFDVLPSLPIIKEGHLLAIDVLWSDTYGYVIAEVNTSPGITIENNLERIVAHAHASRR